MNLLWIIIAYFVIGTIFIIKHETGDNDEED